MSLSTEALFTAALGLQAPWRVERAELNTATSGASTLMWSAPGNA
jgi:hypothetical protein